MRTEYTIVITDKKGKKDYSTYPQKLAFEKFEQYKPFYENRGCTVELFRCVYYGMSLHHAEKMAG